MVRENIKKIYKGVDQNPYYLETVIEEYQRMIDDEYNKKYQEHYDKGYNKGYKDCMRDKGKV